VADAPARPNSATFVVYVGRNAHARPPTSTVSKSEPKRSWTEMRDLIYCLASGFDESVRSATSSKRTTSASTRGALSASPMARLGGASDARCVLPDTGTTFCSAVAVMLTSVRTAVATASEKHFRSSCDGYPNARQVVLWPQHIRSLNSRRWMPIRSLCRKNRGDFVAGRLSEIQFSSPRCRCRTCYG
jgi:hypothetical protein